MGSKEKRSGGGEREICVCLFPGSRLRRPNPAQAVTDNSKSGPPLRRSDWIKTILMDRGKAFLGPAVNKWEDKKIAAAPSPESAELSQDCRGYYDVSGAVSL